MGKGEEGRVKGKTSALNKGREKVSSCSLPPSRFSSF
jgi:hypothetical protein